MTKYVVVSDLQVPYHDQRKVDLVLQFIEDWQPDVLLNVGDDIDAPEPSRWNKGMAGEYAGTLQRNLDRTTQVHAMFREALGPNKPYHVMRSNHGDRLETYVRRYAPALESLRSLFIDRLIGYEALGITYHRHLFEFTPGWVLAHGDEGSMSRTPGGTALGLAKQLNKSVICGHTHRLGIMHQTTGFSGKYKTMWGIEVGHLMDINKASYLSDGVANWQAGFLSLSIERNDVNFVPHLFQGRKMLAYGKVYRG